ncbi:MAG: hypothetical protein ACC707_06795 [Thiohalomonadales bacterium]
MPNNQNAITKHPDHISSAQAKEAGSAPASNNQSDIDESPLLSATAILAAKFPTSFAEDKDHKSKSETRYGAVISIILLSLVGYGWMQWSGINFQADGDFHYNSGLIGGIIMLLVLVYAVRKRVKLFNKFGSMEGWYYFHLIGGILGPVLIIFHSSFALKAVNSGVSFIAMLLIVVSGFFGRYVYTRIGYNLHRKLLSVKDTEKILVTLLREHNVDFTQVIEKRLAKFALASLAGPGSILYLPFRFLSIRAEAAKCYVLVSHDVTRVLRYKAQEEAWGVDKYNQRLRAEKIIVRKHINSIIDIAQTHLWERLLVRWRILHIPLLYILVVTGVAHVFAVHMY